MNSTPNLKEAEANDVLIARADARLAHAYEQIAHADEQLARVTEQLSRMEQAAGRHPSAGPGRKASRDTSTLRGLIGLLLAACIGVAAFVSQSSYGNAVKPIISRWAPYLTSTQLENSGLPAQPRPSVQLAAAEAAPPQATPSASGTAQDLAPAVAPTSSELAQLFKEMTRVLTNVEQGVEQLKAGQEQMASNNAKVVENSIGRPRSGSGAKPTLRAEFQMSAIEGCVQPVSATLSVVYRLAFRSPRSFADVD
jgi:hypothetical protein